jgi:hypothetical protein
MPFLRSKLLISSASLFFDGLKGLLAVGNGALIPAWENGLWELPSCRL